MVQRTMVCVHGSISLSGETFHFVPSERGLREGEPMCPLLSVMVIEFLSRRIKFAKDTNSSFTHV